VRFEVPTDAVEDASLRMLQMIIPSSSSRSSSLRRLAKQEKRGVQELLKTNIQTVF
jgi:hypothetical protein